jgi:hypothetical protein
LSSPSWEQSLHGGCRLERRRRPARPAARAAPFEDVIRSRRDQLARDACRGLEFFFLSHFLWTGARELDTAVRAVNGGAFDYLVKPFDLESVSRIIERALATRSPQESTGTDRMAAVGEGVLLVGSSPPMQEVFKQI